MESQTESFSLQKFIPTAMRIMGAGVLICATVAFLMQQSSSWSDSGRFFLFLGFSTALGMLGYITGVKMEEAKGARTFLLVLAAVIPAHFCQLGGLIYSGMGFVAPLGAPTQLIWQTVDIASALAVTGLGTLVLLPLTLLAFGVLARKHSGIVTFQYLAFSALLLLPVRDPNFIAAIVLCGAAIALWADLHVYSQCSTLKTFEGRVVRSLMFAPVVLLIARTAFLYGRTTFFEGLIAAGFAVAFCGILPRYTTNRHTSGVLQAIGAAPTLVAWYNLTAVFNEMFYIEMLSHSIYGFTLSGILFLQSRYAVVGRSLLSTLSSIVLLCTGIFNMTGSPDLSSAVIAMVAGIGVTLSAFFNRHQWLAVFGVLTAVGGIVQQVKLSMVYYSMNPWMILAATGIALVFGSSYLEKYGKALLMRFASEPEQERDTVVG